MTDIASELAIAVFFLVLCLFFYLSSKSSNVAWKSFGFIYFLYSIPFFLVRFKLKYFGTVISVHISLEMYLWLIFLTFVMMPFILFDGGFSKLSERNFVRQQRYVAPVSIGLIGVSIVAFANDLTFWGQKLFLIGDAARWGSGLHNANLFFISVNYVLLAMAGFYGLYSDASEKGRSRRAIIFLVFFVVFAVVGLMQGHRYYVALLFLAWLFHPGMSSRGRNSTRYIWTLVATPLILVIAANIKSIYTYIIYYNFVKNKGLFGYLYDGFNWFPHELKAIAANTYLGYSSGGIYHVTIMDYLVKLIPFSSRFYDFYGLSHLYNEVAVAANLGVHAGQGTAFSFYLENMQTYFSPLFILVLIALVWRIFPNSIVSIFMIYFSLNLIRNGAEIALSEIKIALLVFFAIYFSVWILRQICQVGAQKSPRDAPAS